MHQCRNCDSSRMAGVITVSPAEERKKYQCQDCGYTMHTVEVPEEYLRELISRSIRLGALEQPKA